jgi:glucokinase
VETVGVDVGGTKVAAAALGEDGLSTPSIVATATASAEALLDCICDAVAAVRTTQTRAVGVGVPSVVDYATGRARSSVNVPFEDVPLREVLGRRLGLPVYVDNDATVAALAEAWDGERIAVESLVMFTVGTGLGGGLVLGGRIYRGATGAAAEIGHTIVGLDLSGAVPQAGRFPQAGSLESLAAGGVLDRLAAEASRREPESALGRVHASQGVVRGRDAVAAAHAGDEVAVAVIERLGERLGLGIANAINTLDPEVVAVGGGVSAAGELLLGPARGVASAYVLPGVGTRTEIRLARHGNAAGMLGAALLAATEQALGQR